METRVGQDAYMSSEGTGVWHCMTRHRPWAGVAKYTGKKWAV